jgi:hypothetical protein
MDLATSLKHHRLSVRHQQSLWRITPCVTGGEVANPRDVTAWQRQVAARQVQQHWALSRIIAHHRALSRSFSRRFRVRDRYIATGAWRLLLLITWMFESSGAILHRPQPSEVQSEFCHGECHHEIRGWIPGVYDEESRPRSALLYGKVPMSLMSQHPSGSASLHACAGALLPKVSSIPKERARAHELCQ